MKKALALILTAAMLLSCMIVGISAVREHATNVETVVTTDKAATNTANFVGFENSFYADNYTFSITMKSCVADFGQMADNVGFLEGSPIISMVNGTIGWNGHSETVSYEFADDTWYTIQYTVADGKTVVSVNGEEIGTVNKTIRAMLYGSFYASYVTEIYFKSGDNYALYEDFEDGVDDVFSTEVTTFEDVKTNVSYENNNVTYNKFGAATNTANFVGFENSFYADNYTFTIIMKSCVADFGQMADNVGFLEGSPIISMKNGTIGWNGHSETVSYEFADDTWYTIQYKVADGKTVVLVDGEEIGTVNKTIRAMLYGSFYASYVRFVGFSDGNNYALYEDYTDGTDDVFSTELTYFTEVGNKYDLGMKYYYWDYDTVAYHENLNYKDGALQKYAFDFCIDMADGGFINDFFGGGVVLTDKKVAIGDSYIALDIDLNKWYHIALEDAGSEIDVYLDDAYIGSLAADKISPNGICGHASHIAIDNLQLNDVVEDFEDGEYNAWSTGTAGLALEYEFEAVGPDTIFDHIATPSYEGTAFLAENSWDGESNYIEQGNLGNLGDHYIVDFNLAILPTNNSADGNFFEIWTNWDAGSPIRWKVGTEFLGKDDDLVLFDWGEATKDNFHRVTYEFKNNRGYIYVDGVELYDGLCGSYKALSLMIMMPWNANVIIDDFAIYNGDYELIKDSSDLKTGSGYGYGNNVLKWVNLDADDYCAENGCMTGKTTMEYDSTCYATGNYQTWCAVCGELKDNHEIALKNHVWAGYSMDNKTDTGLVFTYCKNDGCVEKRYTELPKNYEGKLYQFFDMQDDFVLVFGDDNPASASGLDGFSTDGEPAWIVTEDGKLEFLGHVVWDEFWGIEDAKMPVNDWSVSYDFFLDESKHWKNEDGGIDNEGFHIRCCGAAGYQLRAGYDRVNEKLFIEKSDGSKVLASCDYKFEDLTTYNFKVACKYEGYNYTHQDPSLDAPWYAEISIWVDGEKVLAYGDTTGADQYSIYDIAYGADLGAYHKFPTFGQFGTSYTIDNLAFGSYDFEIVKIAGDIDGDGILSAADALMMRQFLAGLISADDFGDASVADVNGDGAINAKDQLAIRIALA